MLECSVFESCNTSLVASIQLSFYLGLHVSDTLVHFEMSLATFAIR